MSRVDHRDRSGPFDIIGDVHGCTDEVENLLRTLAYTTDPDGGWRSAAGRTAIFIGDLVDRGPRNVDALALAMRMTDAGTALCVPGNHDLQLERYLAGEDVPLVYGLDGTVEEIERESPAFRAAVLAFLRNLPSHVVLDDGRLVVAHAGLAERWHGQESATIRTMAAYGVADGELDPFDASRRHPWVASYRGSAVVVYGHTVVPQAVWRGNTIDIDTGCVFGIELTALRWPERDLVSVPARRTYATRGG